MFQKKIVKRLVSRRLIRIVKTVFRFINITLFKIKFKRKIKSIHHKYARAVVLMATPVHGNLGDHAIVFAEYRYFSDAGFKKKLIEIPNDMYLSCKKYIRKHLSKTDIIVIDGGGNLGTLWPWEDDKITEIIRTYSNNDIIVFPQTCFYGDEKSGIKSRLEINRKSYGIAKGLCVTLRDNMSYQFFTSHFKDTKALLIPDIVLYLTNLNVNYSSERNGVLLCFREDCERAVCEESVSHLQSVISTMGIVYRKTSTIRSYAVTQNIRERELQKIWFEFASAKLVITDRLHGMIFSTITNTPCLAIDNVSKKVSGVNRLISDVSYVRVCDTVDDIIRKIPDFYHLDSCRYEDWNIQDKYKDLKEIIRNMCI